MSVCGWCDSRCVVSWQDKQRQAKTSERVAETTSRSSLQPRISASLANVFHSQRHQLLHLTKKGNIGVSKHKNSPYLLGPFGFALSLLVVNCISSL